MRIIILMLIASFSMLSFGTTFSASSCSSIFSINCVETIPYCENPAECGIESGITSIKGKIDTVVDDRPLSQYIQDVIVYVLGFVTLIAVIYIIYAGFLTLIGGGDEEKMKKTKGIITYVIIGILIMWLAYSIVIFIMDTISSGAAVI